MARLFGTDGIRGVANVDLKPTTAYALGRAVAHRLAGRGGAIVVGQDTRRSGDMFVAAIASGATSLGVDVHVVGIIPTPALAFIAGQGPFAAGIMVSASHNPAADNGLKVLDADGLKLDDSIEDELEQLIWRTEELGGAPNDELGRMVDASARLADYRAHRLGLASSIDGARWHLVLDTANGSGSVVAPDILAATGGRTSRPAGTVPSSTRTDTSRDTSWSKVMLIRRGLYSRIWMRGSMGRRSTETEAEPTLGSRPDRSTVAAKLELSTRTLSSDEK